MGIADLLQPFLQPSLRAERYQTLGVLGEGGHGIVFRATDSTRPGTEVALKRVSPSVPAGQRPLLESRLLREASPGFSHPNVVTPLDSGRDAHGVYVVFPLAPGRDLVAHAEDGWLPTDEEAVGIIRAVARGLSAMHAAGRQHRDIKPNNIIYDPGSGSTAVIDLGLISDPSASPRLTRPGQPIGTLSFASPESINAPCQTDPRSDLHAVGCLLYWLYAGESPFEAASEAEAIRRVTQETPRPLLDINPSTPAHLSALAQGLLTKPLGRRWPQTADALLNLLDPVNAHAGPLPTANLPCVVTAERCLACGSPSPRDDRCVVCHRTYVGTRLRCRLHDGRTREFYLPLGRYPIGRHEVSRSNPRLSRRQAEVLVTPSEISIRHLEGRHPTFVDGRAASRSSPTRVRMTLHFADIDAELIPPPH